MSVYQARFAARYTALAAWAAIHGHTDIPLTTRFDGYPLGSWVAYLRSRHRRHGLPPAQVAALETLPGWTWQPRRPGPPADHPRNTHIHALRSQGATLAAIAATVGVSRQRVHQILTRPPQGTFPGHDPMGCPGPDRELTPPHGAGPPSP